MADPRLAAALREIAAGYERAAALLEGERPAEVPTDIDAQKAKRALKRAGVAPLPQTEIDALVRRSLRRRGKDRP